MSSHPNVCLVAIIKSNIPDDGNFPSRILEEDLGVDIQIGDTSHDLYAPFYGCDDSGLGAPSGTIGIHEYLTYGWGDSISLTDMNIKIVDFGAKVANFCREHNCSYTINIQANWF